MREILIFIECCASDFIRQIENEYSEDYVINIYHRVHNEYLFDTFSIKKLPCAVFLDEQGEEIKRL